MIVRVVPAGIVINLKGPGLKSRDLFSELSHIGNTSV